MGPKREQLLLMSVEVQGIKSTNSVTLGVLQ